MKFFCLAKSEHFFSAEKRVSKYKNGAEKICGADFLFIDTDPYFKSDEEYLPDTARAALCGVILRYGCFVVRI